MPYILNTEKEEDTGQDWYSLEKEHTGICLDL